MRPWKFGIAILFCSLVSLTGCAGNNKVLPKHDETLRYPLAYDLTYLRTIEALEHVPDWELDETEKEKGIIRVRNIDYAGLGDKDQRLITFNLKRVGKKETSIQIAPNSQRVSGGDVLLESITKYMKQEMKSA